MFDLYQYTCKIQMIYSSAESGKCQELLSNKIPATLWHLKQAVRCLLCKEMVTSSHIPCNYNNHDIQKIQIFPPRRKGHILIHIFIKLKLLFAILFASATTLPPKQILASFMSPQTHLEYPRSTLPPSPDRIFSRMCVCVWHINWCLPTIVLLTQ